MSNQSNDGVHGYPDPKLMMEALLGEMRRMRTGFEDFNERLERMENAQQAPQPRVPDGDRRGRVQRQEVQEEFEDFNGHDFEEENNMRFGGNVWRFRGGREDRNREDVNVGSIKMKVPSFQGKNDPEPYSE